MKKKYEYYGNKTLGGGTWLNDDNFSKISDSPYSNEIIKKFETMVWQDICRTGIQNKIKRFYVLNIGSGREALALQNLGAKYVDFLDKSKSNCKKMNNLKNDPNSKIREIYNLDICSNKFKKVKKKYDFIYLNGVLHHTKNPHLALKNLCKKLNKNGILWLYLYQMGSAYNIYRILQRKIFSKSKIKHKFIYSYLSKKFTPRLVEREMDDLGCEYMHIYPIKFYTELFKKFGLKIIYTKDVFEKIKPSIRLSFHSCLCAIKIDRVIKNTKLKRMDNVNFLKSSFYEKEDKETIINLNIKYKKILKILSKKGSKKKFLRIIALLTTKKKNYLHLDSYENKKKDLIDTFNKIYNLLK
jgi:SAM-dependent methyltransferase